jgi:hypothetical protein
MTEKECEKCQVAIERAPQVVAPKQEEVSVIVQITINPVMLPTNPSGDLGAVLAGEVAAAVGATVSMPVLDRGAVEVVLKSRI